MMEGAIEFETCSILLFLVLPEIMRCIWALRLGSLS